MKRGEEKIPVLAAGNLNWSSIRILSVDDDPEVLQYFRDSMVRFNAHCDTAASAEEALNLVGQNGHYDIYFVDYNMPGTNGIELTKLLKAKPGNAAVVLISAIDSSYIEEDAKKAGIDKFMSKPLFPSTIADMVGQCMGMDQYREQEARTDSPDVFPGRCILLVEDVEVNREIVMALLEPTLLKIDCAVNGVEAVRMFSDAPEKYDLIFMDIQMPEMDGYEATGRIRALDNRYAKTIPIVAMTANVFRKDIERCEEAGMNGHIGKPLNLDDVMDKLRTFLR
jgi:CheY-like chemotaxis protein